MISPPYSGFILRDYQNRSKLEIKSEFAMGAKGLFLAAPTGSGKTETFTSVVEDYVRERQWNCVICGHREELLDQSGRSVKRRALPYGIIKGAPSTNPNAKIQIVSTPSMKRRDLPWEPDLIVLDEAHRINYEDFLARHPNAKRLLVSASPCRTDGRSFREWADKMIIAASISELLHHKDGPFLVPAAMYPGKQTDRLDRIIRKHHGDFDKKEAEAWFNREEMIRDVVDKYIQYGAGMKALMFGQGVDHSMGMCMALNEAGFRAEHIDGDTSPEERRAIRYRHQTGQTQIVCNAMLWVEGYDDKTIEYIGMAFMSESLVKYVQTGGRGMRPAKGKSKVIVVDHGQNQNRHGHLMLDRDWSLYKAPTYEYHDPLLCKNCQACMPKNAYVCLVCGYRRIAVNGSVVMLHPEQAKKAEHEVIKRYRQLLRWALKENKHSGWAYVQLIQRFGQDEVNRHLKYNHAVQIVREEGF